MTTCVLALFFTLLLPASAQLAITEFMARNTTGLKDEDGDVVDWIELTNVGAEAVNTEGWHLTDNDNQPKKWALPAGSVAAGARLVVFASNKNRRAEPGKWHTNFELSGPGEYLALVKPDGQAANEYLAYPPQFTDRSYGVGASNSIGYLAAPTPGEANGELAMDGPHIRNVAHEPLQPKPGDDILVTAHLAKRFGAVAKVTLLARAMYRPAFEIPMRDDGAEGDAKAGDGIYSAKIPANGEGGPTYAVNEMIRWAVLAEDDGGKKSREPAFLDNTGIDQSPEFFGTVAKDPNAPKASLPVMDWFTEREAGTRTRTGARASVFFQGRFQDNILVRARGGATNGSSQKFEFNNAWPGYLNDAMPAVGEVNMNANGGDASYLRQTLAFDTFQKMGHAACTSFLVVMNINTKPHRLGVLIEQVNEDFLERNDYDSNGELYKMVQRSNLNPVFSDITTGVIKKTGYKLKDLGRFKALVDGLKLPADQRRAFLCDSLNLPQILNYCAIRSIIMDADDVRKNFYMYQDIRGTGEWSIFPWDKDWTFGVEGDGAPHLRHPFFGDQKHAKANANQWNMLYNAINTDPVFSQMYLRRLRTLMDAFLQPPDTPEAERYFEKRLDELYTQAEPHLPTAAKSNRNTIRTFLTSRRRDLYQTYHGPSAKEALIPLAQSATTAEFQLTIGAMEFAPASGEQDEEYIEIVNPTTDYIDVSGWTLEGGVRFTFPPGAIVPASGQSVPGKLYVSPNSAVFRGRKVSPKGGEGLFVVGPYQGHLSNVGETITLKTAKNAVVAQKTYIGQGTDLERYLFVSELMYHPKPPHEDAEFIELINLSDTITLDLTGAKFTRGVEFAFPAGTSLAPGARLLVVKSKAAFEAIYGAGLPVVGEFAGGSSLSNAGENLKIEDAQGRSLVEFGYKDGEKWPAADGMGPSLVVAGSGRLNLDDPASWKASASPNGTPGKGESASGFTGDPLADLDGDGVKALLEYAFGMSDRNPSQGPGTILARREAGLFIVLAPKPTPDVELTLEVSPDLRTWVDAGLPAKTEGAQLRWEGPTGGKSHFRVRAKLR